MKYKILLLLNRDLVSYDEEVILIDLRRIRLQYANHLIDWAHLHIYTTTINTFNSNMKYFM